MSRKSPQEDADEVHAYAADIHELKHSNVGDRQASPEDYKTDDHNWWHGYYKRDTEKYGGDAPSKRTIKRALKHIKSGNFAFR